MPVQILTGTGADGAFTAEIRVIEEKLNDTEGLLNKIVDGVVMPALKRNWDNAGFRDHGSRIKGVSGKRAVTVRGAQGNVVRILGSTALITYDTGQVRHVGALIDGRVASVPRNAPALAFNSQYGPATALRKFSRGTTGKPLYYLTGADEDKIEATVAEWITSE
jgi:hypothetical protein